MALIGCYSIKMSHRYYIEQYKNHILKEGELLSQNLELLYDENITELGDIIKQKANHLELQTVLIDEKGNIISESESYDINNTKNLQENELINKLKNQNGISVDVPITINQQEMILRLSVPLKQLNGIKNDMLMNVIISTIVAFFCAYYLSKRMSEPLDKLANAAFQVFGNTENKIKDETENKKMASASNDQIAYLTEIFHKMSTKLNTTITALEAENKKMEAIVNSMINGVVAIDKKNKILMINSQCYKLFDIKNNYCKGLDFYDIFKNQQIQALLEKSISEKKNIVEIVILKSNFNGDKILRVYINPILFAKENNNSFGTLLVFQDITQIKKLEKIRSDFVSNVTHELKTPLTSIMGFTDTLRSGAIQNQDMAKHFLEIIDIETHRLYRLIQDILSLSEIETRKEDTNMQYESIEEILEHVKGLLFAQAEEKGLQLIVECETMPPYFCNRDKISQMFINLIENAIKYTEKGSVTVKCKYQGKYFIFQVEDTGIGIPQESIERIFERFYRVDKGRSRKAGGTGLGLSIVKHIMMLYNGKVKVESQEGKGTTFTIAMPYEIEFSND